MSGSQGGGYSESFDVYNRSPGKLHLVGLATRHKNIQFIDLSQPGAFEMTLYPGQTGRAQIDGGETTMNIEAKVYLKVQDYQVEQ